MSSFTQAQLDNLEAMIAGGVLESEYDGKRIKYRSMADLIQAKNLVARALTAASQRSTGYNPVYDKGV